MKILYRGASLLDPEATIMVIATEDSANRKTGPMTQLWILRTDKHPLVAVRDGDDRAICGDCAHRGINGLQRSCYVTVAHAPAAVFRAWRAGRYEDLSAAAMPRVSHAVRDGLLRIGAYGDPAAVPVDWWRGLLRRARGWTAYTHHWRTCALEMREICMASVDTEAEQREALAKGYRTFRVRTDDSALMHDETLCPASDEGGHRTTCSKCLLCDGAERGDTRRNVAILVHRTTMTFYRSRQLDLFEEKL